MRILTTLALTLALTIGTATTALAFEPGTGHCDLENTISLSFPTEPEYLGKILIPTDANPETTPTVLVDGYWIPEEAPDGSYPLTAWLDNSPAYAGGWYLQVNDSTSPPVIKWREMTPAQWDLTTTEPKGL